MKERILEILKEYSHILPHLKDHCSDLAITDDQFDDLANDIAKILNVEIRESCKSVCGLGVNPYCSDRAKDGTCLHDAYCKHKQADMERT